METSISDLLLKANQVKKAFIAAPTKEAAAMPPMDPSAMPPAGDPNAMPMPPVPPTPPEAVQDGDPIADITNVISQMADGLDKIEIRQDAADQKMQDIVSEFSKIQGKIDLLLSILGKGNV